MKLYSIAHSIDLGKVKQREPSTYTIFDHCSNFFQMYKLPLSQDELREQYKVKAIFSPLEYTRAELHTSLDIK